MSVALLLGTVILVSGVLGYLLKSEKELFLFECGLVFMLWVSASSLALEWFPNRFKEYENAGAIFTGGCSVLSYVFFRLRLLELGVCKFKKSMFLWVFATVLVQLIISFSWAWGLKFFMGDFKPQTIGQDYAQSSINVRLALGSVVVLWAPLTEEFFIRGFIWNALKKYAESRILITGLIFGFLHFESPASVVPLCVFGFLLGWLRQKSGSIWPSVMAHASNNAVVLFFLSTA